MDAEEAGAGAGAGPSETGRRSVGGVMSKTSKADYAVYTLGRPGQTKVVAIIDAKKHITPHSVAQIIGYYSAFEVGDPRPLVVVLTAYELKIVIIPFHDGSQRLVNAVELQEFKLWKGEGRMLDVGVLSLLLSLMHDESFLRNYSVEAKKANIPQEARIPKNRVCTIVTDQAKFEEISKNLSALNRMVRQLKEDRVKWLREQKQQQRAEEDEKAEEAERPGDEKAEEAERPGDEKAEEAEPGDEKAEEAERPGDEKAEEAEPGDEKAGEAEPGDEKAEEAEPGDEKAGEGTERAERPERE